MKDLILMLTQIVGVVCFLGFIFSLLNIAFGWHIGFKGAEVPADIRATASFLAVAAICGAIVYFWEYRGKPQETGRTEKATAIRRPEQKQAGRGRSW